MDHWMLKGHVAVPVPFADWRMQSIEERRVAEDTIGDVRVSTVFLGLDHGWGDGPPQIFETMIFGGPHDEYQDRYASWQEAEEGHAYAVALVRGEKMQAAARFRKKPVEVEAMPFDGTEASANEILEWVGQGASYRPGINALFITTLEGVMTASSGDWIAKGIEGEFYPIKDSIFQKTYEPAE